MKIKKDKLIEWAEKEIKEWQKFVALTKCNNATNSATIKIDKKLAKLVKGSKNFDLLTEFYFYCLVNKDLRFFQALSGWLGKDIIVGGEDPFYFKGKK